MNKPDYNVDLDAIKPLLPARTAVLAEVAGLPAAIKLVELRGGRRVYIPKTAHPDHWLVPHIGLDALQALARHYRGADIEIDRCLGLKRAIVVAEYERGVPVSRLAETYGCTERNIRLMTIAAIGQPTVKLAALNVDWIEEFL